MNNLQNTLEKKSIRNTKGAVKKRRIGFLLFFTALSWLLYLCQGSSGSRISPLLSGLRTVLFIGGEDGTAVLGELFTG